MLHHWLVCVLINRRCLDNFWEELLINREPKSSRSFAPFYPLVEIFRLFGLFNFFELHSKSLNNLLTCLCEWWLKGPSLARWMHFIYDQLIKFSSRRYFSFLTIDWKQKSFHFSLKATQTKLTSSEARHSSSAWKNLIVRTGTFFHCCGIAHMKSRNL